MPDPQGNRPKRDEYGIVLLGSFNPPIFQPAWFAAYDLLPLSEAEEAEIELIHRELVAFSLPWLDVQVARDRFAVRSDRSPNPGLLRDLVVGTLDILSHTPVVALGINRDAHYEMATIEDWDDVGSALVPRERWQNLLKQPGMRSLTEEGLRDDEYPGYIRVKVEPSVHYRKGVYIQVNDHYGPFDESPKSPNEAARRVLHEEWDNAQQRAGNILEHVTHIYAEEK